MLIQVDNKTIINTEQICQIFRFKSEDVWWTRFHLADGHTATFHDDDMQVWNIFASKDIPTAPPVVKAITEEKAAGQRMRGWEKPD